MNSVINSIPLTKEGVVRYAKSIARRSKSEMCRVYHIHSDVKKMTPEMAQEELARRLLFEITFDIIPPAVVFNGEWLDQRLRNFGHSERMRRLWTKAKRAELRYTWITPP